MKLDTIVPAQQVYYSLENWLQEIWGHPNDAIQHSLEMIPLTIITNYF